MSKAKARHILVKDEKVCADLKQKIEGGASFADLAAKHSLCPSGKRGGDLGEFTPGQMVREFDEVVLLDRRFWLHVQDGMLGIEVVLDHVSLLLQSLRSKGRTHRQC